MVDLYLLIVIIGILLIAIIGIFFARKFYIKDISPNELITRVSFSQGHITRKDKKSKIGEIKVKPSLFDSKDNEASIFRISGLDDRSIWFIGKWVQKEKEKKQNASGRLRGRADILVRRVLGLKLTVVSEEPPPKHGNIKGFPNESEKFNTHQRLADISDGYLVRDIKPSIDNILSETTEVSPLYS